MQTKSETFALKIEERRFSVIADSVLMEEENINKY